MTKKPRKDYLSISTIIVMVRSWPRMKLQFDTIWYQILVLFITQESFKREISPAAETFPAPSLSINFPRNFPTALNLNTKKALTSPGSS